ncbi:MAG: ABC transporter ATP-binding protein [Actinomycetia bacterium]|nr:ABC transporter ATP-binding protein [Actinomycetes bacterium]
MAEVHVNRLHKAYPDGTVAVEELDLRIADGELFVMLGPSGCGKTTTLRCIAGLEEETAGQIVIGDEDVTGLRPSQRDIAMVFQFYALYPHLNAHDNMAFPLRAQGLPQPEIDSRVEEATRLLQLESILSRKPSRLSGGEQQRVALGRAMVRQPQAFLMDEPLTNLDAELRADMRAEVKHLQKRLETTMVYVTHDQTEAMALGDRIAILNGGRLEQVGSPMEVYDRPATLFAARFIGSPPMNLLAAEVTDGHLTTPDGLRLAAPDGLRRGQRVVAGVRPEGFTVSESDGAQGADAVPGTIVSREALGDETIYVVETESSLIHARMPATSRLRPQQRVQVRHLGAPPPAYDPQTEVLVSR